MIRKGGNEKIVYFGEEVEIALLNYLEERENMETKPGHENALFLSLQGTRLSVRATEKMVKNIHSQSLQIRISLPISCVLHMARLFTRKQVIFILWQMFWAIKVSLPRRSIMRN